MKRAAIYCRVSTEDQEREGTSIQSQQEACLAKAKELGCEVPKQLIFIETYSGLTLDRSQLTILRNKARNGEIEAVIVLKPDRLCRNGEDILVLAKEFKLESVKLVFVKEQWEDTLQGKATAFMLGWAGEMYVASMIEATTRGKAKLVEQGVLPQGTGAGLYGYKWDKSQKKRLPHEFEAKVVEKIFTMIAEGVSRFNVTKALHDQAIPTKSGGKWHPLTINRIVTNPAYIGLTYFGKTRGSRKTAIKSEPQEVWKLLPSVTPPIIGKDLFDRAQKALQQAKEARPASPQHDYLLTGHIVCGHCGSPVVGSCLNRKHRYYRCRATRSTATNSATCSAHYIRADYLENVVWGKVKEVLEKPELILAELRRHIEDEEESQSQGHSSVDKAIEKLRRKVHGYDSQEKRLVHLLRHDQVTSDYVLDEINRLKQERQTDQEELSRFYETKERLEKLAKAEIQLNEWCSTVRDNLDRCTIQEKRLALDALDIKVVASSELIDIKGTIPLEVTPMPSSPDGTTIAQTSA